MMCARTVQRVEQVLWYCAVKCAPRLVLCSLDDTAQIGSHCASRKVHVRMLVRFCAPLDSLWADSQQGQGLEMETNDPKTHFKIKTKM